MWKTIHAVFRTEWLGRNPQATDFIVLIQYYVSFWNTSTGNQSQFLVHTTVTLGPTCSLVLAYILFRSWIFTSGLQFKMFFIRQYKQSAWCALATIFVVAKCLARMYISLQPVCFFAPCRVPSLFCLCIRAISLKFVLEPKGQISIKLWSAGKSIYRVLAAQQPDYRIWNTFCGTCPRHTAVSKFLCFLVIYMNLKDIMKDCFL